MAVRSRCTSGVLKRFFGIEAADMEEPTDTVEPDWNPAPEPVVPLAEVAGSRSVTFTEPTAVSSGEFRMTAWREPSSRPPQTAVANQQ